MTALTPVHDLPDQERRDAQAIRHYLGDGPVGVAFSGGVDSAVLLAVAHQSLGPQRSVGILAVSPSLAGSERVTANRVARSIGANLIELQTSELDDPAYATNPVDRCYFCKNELFTRIDEAFLQTHRLRAVAYGENADDQARIDRPGARAASAHRVLRPLAEAGLGKARVRNLARELGLEVADKPASPCLASRIPHGEPVTARKLAAIEAAEEVVRRLGFSDCRVRHHGTIARIELPVGELARALEPDIRGRLVAEVKSAGFRHVTIDLRGLQSGAFTMQVLGRHE